MRSVDTNLTRTQLSFDSDKAIHKKDTNNKNQTKKITKQSLWCQLDLPSSRSSYVHALYVA